MVNKDLQYEYNTIKMYDVDLETPPYSDSALEFSTLRTSNLSFSILLGFLSSNFLTNATLVLRSSDEPSELSQLLRHDYSTINIIRVYLLLLLLVLLLLPGKMSAPPVMLLCRYKTLVDLTRKHEERGRGDLQLMGNNTAVTPSPQRG